MSSYDHLKLGLEFKEKGVGIEQPTLPENSNNTKNVKTWLATKIYDIFSCQKLQRSMRRLESILTDLTTIMV